MTWTIEDFTLVTKAGSPSSSRYVEVYSPLGVFISRHNVGDDIEAVESVKAYALENGIAGDYEFRRPSEIMSIRLLRATQGSQPGDPGVPPPDDPPLAPVGGFLNNFTVSTVRVNWLANSEPDIDSYRIYKSLTGPASGFTQIGSVLAPTVFFDDTSYDPNVQQWYRLTAVDNIGQESDFSDTITESLGPFITDAVLSTTDVNGDPIAETSKNTYSLFRDQSWSVLGRYSWRVIPGSLPVGISITPLPGGDYISDATVGTIPGTYNWEAQVWDNVLQQIIYDTVNDPAIQPVSRVI